MTDKKIKTSEYYFDKIERDFKKGMRNVFILWIFLGIGLTIYWHVEGYEWVPQGMTKEEYLLEKYHSE